MRDLVVLALTFGSSFFALIRPWMGVLALSVFAYMSPHRYAWGYSKDFPVFFIVFIATVLGMLLNSKDTQPFPWTKETITMLFLLVWFTLTTFLSPDFPIAAENQWIKVNKVYLGLIPTLFLINTRERFRWLIIILALSFGLLGLKGGVFALGTGFNYQVRGPSDSFYGGNNEIALALNMTLPLILLCAKEAKKTILRNFFYATFFLSVCSIISSWSRGGFLTLSVVLAALLVSSKRKWLVISSLIVGLMFFIPKMPEKWFGRMETIQTYEQDISVQGRFRAWEYAIDKALDNPLTGGGFETFQDAWVDAHSAYFEILGEHGFIALGLWLSLLFGTLFSLERLRRIVKKEKTDGNKWIIDNARAVQIAILAYSVGGLFLGVAYWEYFYHLIMLYVLMKVLSEKTIDQKLIANA
jgi:putative inorganic carbon (HCO3(-)) transporter